MGTSVYGWPCKSFPGMQPPPAPLGATGPGNHARPLPVRSTLRHTDAARAKGVREVSHLLHGGRVTQAWLGGFGQLQATPIKSAPLAERVRCPPPKPYATQVVKKKSHPTHTQDATVETSEGTCRVGTAEGPRRSVLGVHHRKGETENKNKCYT